MKKISTFEEAFPNYVNKLLNNLKLLWFKNGPKKIFGMLKKKQKGGFGKIMSKF